MRKFSAHRIFPVTGPPIRFGIIETTDDGTILNIRDTGGHPVEEAGLEFYPGMIIPGMINAHCHLELSHLKGKIPEKTGLTEFVARVSQIRTSDPAAIEQALEAADRMMYLQGVSGVGDISNNTMTLVAKRSSPVRYHTFIEVFGFDQATSTVRFKKALEYANAFSEAGLRCSLSPHAPYSVGVHLWEMLSEAKELTRRISIHHEESKDELELLNTRSGAMAGSFLQAGFDIASLPEGAADTLALLGKYVPEADWILVHNTLTDPLPDPSDLKPGVFWVLCPRSNQYIGNVLPDIAGFAQSGLKVCLGTDSLASNHSLSVYDEMMAVQAVAPEVPFETLLKWATINGARALGMSDQLGSLEPGKRPGLVNLPIFDWERNRLVASGGLKRLI